MRFTVNVSNKLVGALAVGGVGFAAGQVAATSFPSTDQQMYYSGVLADTAGAPETGIEDISVALFSAPSGGTRLCEASEADVDLAASLGRFRVALPASCSDAVRDNGDVYAQVTVGATTMPRQKLGASPYAVSARDAQSADFATEATNAASAATVGANGVTTTSIVDAAVTTAKIADGVVTTSKLAPSFVSQVGALDTQLEQLTSGPYVEWKGDITNVSVSQPRKFGVATEAVDSAGELGPSGDFVASRAGLYLVNGSWVTDSLDSNCGYNISLRKNDVRYGGAYLAMQSTPVAAPIAGGMSAMVRLSVGDRLHFEGVASGTSTCAFGYIEGWFQIAFLR